MKAKGNKPEATTRRVGTAHHRRPPVAPPQTLTARQQREDDEGIALYKITSIRDWLRESNGRCFRYRALAEPEEDCPIGHFETPRGRWFGYLYVDRTNRLEVLTRA